MTSHVSTSLKRSIVSSNHPVSTFGAAAPPSGRSHQTQRRAEQQDRFTSAEDQHGLRARRWPSCDPSSPFTTTNSRNFTRWEPEERRRRRLPFLKLKPERPSCRRPPASSRSPDPTARPCCPARWPPRSPGAPAAAPPPSLLLLTLKQQLTTLSKLLKPTLKALQTSPPLFKYCGAFYYKNK